MAARMLILGALCAPIGLAWAGILGLSLIGGLISASTVGAGLALVLDVHNSINARARITTIEEEQGKFPDDEYRREWEVGKLLSMAGLQFLVIKLAFLIVLISLPLWGIIALARIVL